jgi:hypothetical protein
MLTIAVPVSSLYVANNSIRQNIFSFKRLENSLTTGIPFFFHALKATFVST